MPTFLTRRLGTVHNCSLAKGSNSCLPKLPPQAPKYKKWIRELRKGLMVSAGNCNSTFFFKSRAAIFSERKRHIKSYPYIIHPFSAICVKREIVMCLLWIFTFFEDPFTTAYHASEMKSLAYHADSYWNAIDIGVDMIMMGNIFLCFITGTYTIQTKEVELQPSKIAKRYLSTYFFFDFFGTFPFFWFSEFFLPSHATHSLYYLLVSCLHFLRFVRIKTALGYFRRITEAFGFEDSTHHIICLALLSFYFLHWWTCLIYIIPKMQYYISGHELSPNSWLVMAGIQPSTKASIGRRYTECLLSAFCHFYKAGVGMYITEEPIEQIMFSLVLITGIFFTSYVIVVVLQMVSSATSSESKYEELINQVGEYMRRKKLPLHLRNRLLLYYENRFQKHYFKEQAILNTLSEHLRYEIFLHSCKGLVEKVALFQGLSRSTVGSIVACLKHEVFLPNDVIIKAATQANALYFISYGTVSLIAASGKEYCHLEDGDHFGEIGLFAEGSNEIQAYFVLSLEITEVFRLEKRDLDHCIFQDEEISERLEKIANERFNQMKALDKEEVYDESKHRRNILYELRKGKVLEHTHHKRRR